MALLDSGFRAHPRFYTMSAFPHARYLKGAHEPAQFVADTGAEVAIAGRSNSGKSSAINALTERHALARTSKTPGQTQLINFFELEPEQRLVDLPGYGFAKVPRPLREHWKRLLESYFRQRESLAALFIVMDARRPLGDQDWQMLHYARARDRNVHLLLTKADKLGRSEAARTLARVRRETRELATAQLFSATAKIGVDAARRQLREFLRAKQPGDAHASPGQTNPAWG
jgi:GTP-binding protein